MSYRLRTLGSIRIVDEEGSEVRLRSVKHTALFVFLNAQRRRAHLRSELCDHFWTTEEKRARHSLSQALYDIRSRIGPVIESGGRDTVSLEAPGAWYDVEELQERTDRGEFGAAAELYRGPFAVELDDVGTAEFEYWLESERRRVRVAGRNAFRLHIEELEEEGRWKELTRVARRFLEHAPEDVDAQRAFVRSLWLSGDRASALEYAASLRDRRPEVAERIRPLVERIEGRTAGKVKETPEPREAPLVGRGDELSTLRQLAGQLAEPRAAHVRGEAGIGKTRLVRELARALDLDGFRQVHSRCWEAESDVPYAAVAEGLEPWLGPEGDRASPGDDGEFALARSALFPGSGDPPSLADDPDALSELRRRVFEEVTEFARGLVAGRPTLWVVEDIQWIDPASAALLHYLLRRLSAAPLLVVFTSRPSARGNDGLTAYLDRPERVEAVDLEPLGEDDVDRLLTEVSDRELSDRTRTRIFELSGGNPYFALELLRAHERREDGDGALDRGSKGPELVDERLEGVLGERLRHVSMDGLKVLEALAVLGGHAPWDPVLSLARVDVDDPSWICEQLTRQGLLETDDREVAFTHDILRELIYSDVGDIRRYSLHRMAAECLAQRGDVSRGVLAKHFHLGGDPVRAFHYAAAAARDAEGRGAHREAARYADRALAAMTDQSDEDEVELRRLAARAYTSAGELAEAVERLEPLLEEKEGGRSERETRALLELAEIQVEQAAEEEARATLSRAKQGASEPGRPTSRLERDMLSTELRLEIHFGDRESIDEAATNLKSVNAGNGSENGAGDGRARLALAPYLAFFESADRAREALQQARSADLPPRLDLRATLLLGAVEVRSCRWDRAEYLLKEGASAARSRSDAWRTGRFTNNLAYLSMQKGEWRAADRLLGAASEAHSSISSDANDSLRLLLNKTKSAFYQLRSQSAHERVDTLIRRAQEADANKYEVEARACLGLLSLQRGEERAARRQHRMVQGLVDGRSLSQEAFKVDWFRAFVGEGESPAAELRERAGRYRKTDRLSLLKLRWLAEVADEGAEAPEVQERLRDRGLLWFEKFAERWTRAVRANLSAR